MQIVQISDLHIGSQFLQEKFDTLVKEVNDLKPDVIVITGDLTNEGLMKEYEKCKELLTQFNTKKIITISGNHDYRNTGYLLFKRYFPFEAINELSDDVVLVTVGTARPDRNEGEVGYRQNLWLDRTMKKYKDKVKIVAMHHHLIAIPEIMGFRILTGIAHAFFWPPCEAIVSNESSEKNRVKNISWFTMFFVIGFMVGPLLGTVFLEELDITYRILFQITAFILATAIITSILASKRGKKNHHEKFSFSSINEMKRFPEVIILLIFCTSSFGIILTIYPAFLNDNGMTDTDILYLYFVFGISRVVSLALAGKFGRKTSQTLIAATIAVSIGLAMSVVGGSIFVYAVALILMGFGFSIFFP